MAIFSVYFQLLYFMLNPCTQSPCPCPLREQSRVCDKCSETILNKRKPFASSIINDGHQDGATEGPIILQRCHHSNATPSSYNAGHMSHSPASIRGSSDPATPLHVTLQDMALSRNSLNVERVIGLGGNR